MAVLKILTSKRKPTSIQQYLTQDTKTRPDLIRGYGVDGDKFGEQFQETQKLFDKMDGRQYYHVIVSLPPNESSTISDGKMNDLGYALALEKFGKRGYEFAVITHTDTEHLHDHIVVNAVNAETGKKLHLTKYDLAHMKERFSELCQEAGLSRVPTNGKQRTDGEYWAEQHGKDSWKKELRDVIDVVRKKAKSYEEFKELLKDEWEIIVDRDNGKGMTYHHPNGNKVRGKKLGSDYDKPSILSSWEQRLQQSQRPLRPRKYIIGAKRLNDRNHER